MVTGMDSRLPIGQCETTPTDVVLSITQESAVDGFRMEGMEGEQLPRLNVPLEVPSLGHPSYWGEPFIFQCEVFIVFLLCCCCFLSVIWPDVSVTAMPTSVIPV